MKKIISRQPKQLEQKDLVKIRRFFHKKQNKGICPILKMEFTEDEMVCDHAHTANARNLGNLKEAGLVRGVIHRQANTMEGKITNSFIRVGLHKFDITLSEFLRNLADFIENPPMTHLRYKHPTEKEKPRKLKKNNVKRLMKLFKYHYPNKKIPKCFFYTPKEAGKGKKLTKTLSRLYEEFGLEPEFLKN